jgi:hypothetical protein
MRSTNKTHVDIGALFEFATLKIELDAASKSHLEECAVCMDRLAWMESPKDSEKEDDAPDN